MGHVTFQIRAAEAGERDLFGAGSGAAAEGLHAARTAPPAGSGSGAAGGGAEGGGDEGLISERELKLIERDHADGMTAVQVVDIFTTRGIRFSEATFRKYVQQNLLPRSRRVGRKGKHQGSLGLYPASSVRRINLIKRLMAANYTIEDIQQQFLRYRDEIEALERGLDSVLTGFEADAVKPHLDADTKKSLKKELVEARKVADDLLRRLDGLEKKVTAPAQGAARHKPAHGGAEDLL
jgi:DNA-binding transcriptional MerR regulator